MSENKKEKSTLKKWTRRGFIGIGGLLGVGLVVGVGGYAYIGRAIPKILGRVKWEKDGCKRAPGRCIR